MSFPVAKQLIMFALFSALWIRIGFNADLDPAFNHNAHPNTDLEPDKTFETQKVEFLHETYT
jgi:hypothetical protein